MQTRRKFLKLSAATPIALAGSSMLGSLAGMNAQAMDTDGYKALVCVFLFGGMDCHDTVLPYDQTSYNQYAAIRSSLLQSYSALPGGSSRTRQALLPLSAASASSGGRQFALPPQMSALHGLFGDGKAAIVGNVGPLLQPTDRASLLAGSVPLPKRLFSHNDQQSTWMSFAPEGSQLGWGGRFGDVAAKAGANINKSFSQISLAGNTVFLSGEQVGPYQIGVDGATAYIRFEGRCQGCAMAEVTLRQGVEVIIKEQVPEILAIVDVTEHAGGTDPYFKTKKGPS